MRRWEARTSTHKRATSSSQSSCTSLPTAESWSPCSPTKVEVPRLDRGFVDTDGTAVHCARERWRSVGYETVKSSSSLLAGHPNWRRGKRLQHKPQNSHMHMCRNPPAHLAQCARTVGAFRPPSGQNPVPTRLDGPTSTDRQKGVGTSRNWRKAHVPNDLLLSLSPPFFE